MRNKIVTVTLATMLTLPLMALISQAAPANNGPCAPDVQKFCADVKPGEGRIAECLKAHEPDLSAACQQKHSQIKKAAQSVHSDCVGDAQKFCSNIKPGKGRMVHCLQQHQSELSTQCQSAMKTMKAAVKPKKNQPK